MRTSISNTDKKFVRNFEVAATLQRHLHVAQTQPIKTFFMLFCSLRNGL